jgi:hypothetical protein
VKLPEWARHRNRRGPPGPRDSQSFERRVANIGAFTFGLDADDIARLRAAVEVRARIGLAPSGRFRAARDGAVAVRTLGGRG